MKAIIPLLAATALAGCASSTDGPLAPTFGAALASMDSQIIDPRPAQGVPETSGARAAIGIKAYDRHKVTEPPGPYGERGSSSSDSDDAAGGLLGGSGKSGDKK